MSENSEEQVNVPILRHYCKVCNRGFGCAGALGGHMRSHAIVGGGDHRIENNSNIQENGDDQQTQHPYFLRKNTNRFTSYREIEDRGKCLLDKRVSPDVEKSRNYDQHCGSFEEEEEEDEEDMANCLVMLSNKSFVFDDKEEEEDKKYGKQVEKGMFQCKACKKVFSSHQALGGHRASHKKVKGCYAARFDIINYDEETNNNNKHIEDIDLSSNQNDSVLSLDSPPDLLNQNLQSRRKAKSHECSICHRVFSSGQALGGHKRCHWLTSNLPDNTLIPGLHEFHYHHEQQIFKKPMFNKSETIDLNFPPVFHTTPDIDFNVNNPFSCNDPNKLSLQLWGNREEEDGKNTKSYQQDNNNNNNNKSGDDQSKINLVKLSEFKDVNLDGGSSRWLQMSIASTN